MFSGVPIGWDHTLQVGDTYLPLAEVTLRDGDGVALNLTGVTGEVQLRNEDTLALVLTPTFALVDAAAGKFKWSSPPADTTALSAGRAAYSVRLTWPDGTIRTILDGTVTIRRNVIA